MPNIPRHKVALYPFANIHGSKYRAEHQAESLELSKDPVLWSIQTRILKGEQLSFEDRDYLLQIYRDIAKVVLISKGRQTEFTEYLVNWLLFMLWLHPGTIAIYIASRGSQTSKFSNLRVKEWGLMASDALAKIAPVENHTATVLTLANGSKLYFHSAWEGYEEARSVPADFIAGDEIQSQEVDKIDVLLSAMDHSPYAFFRGVGTGSDEGSAWEKYHSSGTRFKWNEVSKSWIAENPNAEIHSYTVPQTIVPWISEDSIKKKLIKMTQRLYITEVLGGWFKGAKKPITEAMMSHCFRKELSMDLPNDVDHSKPLFFGVDWGGGTAAFTIPWFMQLLDDRPMFRLIYTEKIEESDVNKQYERVAALVDSYKPDKGVMDAGGGTFQVQQMEKRFGHLIPKCIYLSRPEDPWILDHIWDRNTVEVDRTFAIDTQIHILNDGRIEYPGADLDHIEFIIDHFTAIESKTATSRKGEHTTYVHNVGQPDDALHAQNYAWIAWYLWNRAKGTKGAFSIGKMGGK